jgi:antitoxin YefM
MITKDGLPAAVLLSADEFESMQETIFWLSQPRIREDITQAEQAGRSVTYYAPTVRSRAAT